MLRGLTAGFILISVCVVVHTVGLVLLADWFLRHPGNPNRKFSIRQSSLQLISIFAVITFLHLLETLIWAAFYDLGGLFSDLETSWYFSMGSYTTIGYGDVVLPAKWRLLGGIEGINGVLLCGLSAAFLFTAVSRMFDSRALHKSASSRGDGESAARWSRKVTRCL